MKKRLMIGAGALALVAVPAVIGLWGNASFAQTVPVRVPTSGQITLLTPSPTPSDDNTDDNGGDVPRDQRTEPGDDRDVNGSTGSNPAPSPSRSLDDTADDNGGDVPRDQRTEPGDDRDVNGGSDDSGSDDSGHGSNSGSGSDDSGHGSDDSDDSDDDHGGHGEDD